jgi:hypothetical protein
MYDDKELQPGGTIYQAYAMRGWVRKDGKTIKMQEPQDSAKFGISPNRMPFEEQLIRWAKMQRLCRENPSITLYEIAKKMGLKHYQSITQFCNKYGRDMAGRLGRLPKLKEDRFRKGIWMEIMEQ